MSKSEVVAVIQKGNQGIKKWERKYGKDLVCVRYRKQNGKRLITVELIVDYYETNIKAKDVYIQLSKEEYQEYPELINKIKAHKGYWDTERNLWKINNYSKIKSLIKKLSLEGNIRS